MPTFNEFSDKLSEFLTNNITAMLGTIQLTSNERAELGLLLKKLNSDDQKKAQDLLSSKGIDVAVLK
jgi:hypothetical protein